MTHRLKNFLPMSRQEMQLRGWNQLDIILITGDAYVDHPSFGAAIIGRVLERAGFRVGIIAMPDYRNPESIAVLGRPRLFFGVTSGNVDSMISNYTAFKMRRSDDPYAPGGQAGYRPDRAVIVYSNLIKQIFKDVPIVLGGIEASMRRMVHYDFWSDRLRRSILLDSRADMLVYGMGEKAVIEIARALNEGRALENIPGTVYISRSLPQNAVELMPEQDAMASEENYFEFYKQWLHSQHRIQAQLIGKRYLIQQPPAKVTSEELDDFFDLPFARQPHPVYQEKIPAFEMIKDSIISHRGCVSGCSFCALTLHQGKEIVNRSKESILKEVEILAQADGFKGHIRDIGGPSANNYGFRCAINWNCPRNSCIVRGKICKNLQINTHLWLNLLDEAGNIPGVRQVTVGSGIRYDLFMSHPEAERLLERLVKSHISGQLKIAPEHSEQKVLKAMNKEQLFPLADFVSIYERINKKSGKKQYLIPYLMSCHPDSSVDEMKRMKAKMYKIFHFIPDQVQAFIPLPLTISSVQYFTGKDPLTGRKLFVERDAGKRRRQHRIFFARPKKR